MGYFNYSKHRHRGLIYKSWKCCSQKHHKNHKPFVHKSIKKYLKKFWQEFYTLTQTQKIELLQEASYQKYNYDFNYIKNRKRTHRMLSIPCKVCGKTPTLIHHIILLKNGGINKNNNYIRLCELCHAEIHEWLLDDVAQKLHDKMNEEYRAIVES